MSSGSSGMRVTCPLPPSKYLPSSFMVTDYGTVEVDFKFGVCDTEIGYKDM